MDLDGNKSMLDIMQALHKSWMIYSVGHNWKKSCILFFCIRVTCMKYLKFYSCQNSQI